MSDRSANSVACFFRRPFRDGAASARFAARLWVVGASALIALCPPACGQVNSQPGETTPSPTAAGDVQFDRDVRPILSRYCFACHGPDASARQADLRLDLRENLLEELPSGDGPPFAAFRIEDSVALQRISSADPFFQMPPGEFERRPNREQIATLRRWVEQGAAWEEHWAFQPLSRPTIPAAEIDTLALSPIDRFVDARLRSAGLHRQQEAEPTTLIRRLYFDLTGLPPAPQDVDAFLASDQPDVYEKFVDRLLASPRFGERMAVYWLDLVRYADTVGYHGDQEHHISPYRDWVIDAFNQNMPFDQFTIQQIAGDLLPEASVDQKIASGYNRLLQTTHEGGAQDKEYLAIYLADRVRNIGSVWLGLTLGCAQCHDHKFDALTQGDFYRMGAFFADITERGAFPGPDQSPTLREPEMLVHSPLDRRKLSAALVDGHLLADQMRNSTDPALQGLQSELLHGLRIARAELNLNPRRTMITVARSPREIRILPRGNWMDDSGPLVQPEVPRVLGRLAGSQPKTRLDLARWLTSEENPLAARVLVNRLWYLFLGKGIASSLDDHGVQGARPSHPELLDWLAADLAEHGWDLKRTIKRIVISETYRQSAAGYPEAAAIDPGNSLFWRQNRRRIDAEFIRDTALQLAGILVDEVGGRSAFPYQPEGYYAHLNFPPRKYVADTGDDQYRRGVYVHWQRQFLHPMLKAFDAPSREECTAERPRSNTPASALVLLNDPTFVEAAIMLAQRMMLEGGPGPEERIRWAWRQAVSRSPDLEEERVLIDLFQRNVKRFRANESAALDLLQSRLSPVNPEIDQVQLAAYTTVARALLNLDETYTRN